MLTTYFLFISDDIEEMLTVTEERTHPLHKIPFPAITICPETKATRSLVNITDAYHNLSYNLTEFDYSDDE
jgi:hypothetical protein